MKQKTVTLSLTQDQTIKILNCLAEKPYREVAELIAVISNQANGQNQAESHDSAG